MWEAFSGGKAPYPGLNPQEVVTFLDSGTRLDIPNNAACSDEMWVIKSGTGIILCLFL